MRYIISLKMNNEEREEFNKNFSDTADKLIIGSACVPLIFVVGTICQMIVKHIGVRYGICRLVCYSSIIGVAIMSIDAIDKWLSLTWDDIEDIDKKKGIYREIKNSLLPILCWIWNLFIFMYLGEYAR